MGTEVSATGITAPACAKEVALFLGEYGARLLGSGATCLRLEQNINRMAAAMRMRVEMTILPRHLHLTVTDIDSGTVFTTISTVGNVPVSFYIITRLSALSWAMADGRTDFQGALKEYGRIIGSDSSSRIAVLLLISAANASFCRLFGGDVAAMAIVAAATMAGFWLKTFLTGKGCDVRVAVMICAFVSSVLGATDMLFSIGDTPALSVGTSVLYLVPGIPFLNSFSDMLNRHYICACSRLIDAIMLTCCLSAGLCGAMALMHVPMFQ